jgi:hypothetical protein
MTNPVAIMATVQPPMMMIDQSTRLIDSPL